MHQKGKATCDPIFVVRVCKRQ